MIHRCGGCGEPIEKCVCFEMAGSLSDGGWRAKADEFESVKPPVFVPGSEKIIEVDQWDKGL